MNSYLWGFMVLSQEVANEGGENKLMQKDILYLLDIRLLPEDILYILDNTFCT